MTNGMMLLLSSKNYPPRFIPSYKQSEQNTDQYSPNRIYFVFWINLFHNCNRCRCKPPYCKYHNYFSHLFHAPFLLCSLSLSFLSLSPILYLQALPSRVHMKGDNPRKINLEKYVKSLLHMCLIMEISEFL